MPATALGASTGVHTSLKALFVLVGQVPRRGRAELDGHRTLLSVGADSDDREMQDFFLTTSLSTPAVCRLLNMPFSLMHDEASLFELAFPW